MLDAYLFEKHLEDDEVVSQYVHKYWGVASGALAWPTIWFFAGIAILVMAPVRTVFIAFVVWSLFTIQWWLRNFLDYFLDVWIITDRGVISLQWEGWFHRTSSRILYSDIQGVSYEISGIVGTLNRVGTIAIEKVSTGGTISLSHVRHPRKVETLILQNMETYLHTKNLKNAKHVQELLSDIVAGQVQFTDVQGSAYKKGGKARTITFRKV